MPSLPLPVNGTVKNSEGKAIANAIVKFTTAANSSYTTTNSLGQYLFNLANLEFVADETITYLATDQYNNETLTGTFAATGDSKELDLQLAIRTDQIQGKSNRSVHVVNVGGEPVNKDNPFPVNNALAVLNEPATTWTITRVDGQPDSETITINGRTYTRTFTYNSNNLMTVRSGWIRQS